MNRRRLHRWIAMATPVLSLIVLAPNAITQADDFCGRGGYSGRYQNSSVFPPSAMP